MVVHDERSGFALTQGWKKDAIALALLVALVLPLRLWLLVTTEVAARDSIGYIRYALKFETQPWQTVWKESDQHPGYSLAVLAVSVPLRAASGQTDAPTMQLAAQLTSMFAAILLLVPMYRLGQVFFNRRVGFAAALLFQYFPISAHHLSDGLSEPFFLLLTASALLQAVLAVQRRSPLRFAACGLLGGLAYLTRPEGAIVVLVTGLVLAAMQFWPAWRQSWQRCVMCGAALTLVAVAVGSVYVYATGRITNKVSILMIGEWVRDAVRSHADAEPPMPRAPHVNAGGAPLFAALVGITFKKADGTVAQLGRSAKGLTLEVCSGFHYLGVIPAVLGLGWSFARLRRMPGFWVLALYCTLQSAALLALAMTVSYVSDRHVMVLVLCGSYLAVAGLLELPRRVLAFGRENSGSPTLCRIPAFWSLILFTGLIGFCLPKTLQPLHANRAGNHAAGRWLATRLQPGDIVVDNHNWSHFYAGLVFLEGKEPVVPPDVRPTTYDVITRSRDPEINQGRQQGEDMLRAKQGRVVYQWPESADVEHARVVVYARPRDPLEHPWRVATK